MIKSGHAYVWDVLGDPRFVDRVADAGITEVTLAASYHAVRAATPLHPKHQIVDAAHAALYRPLRPQVWANRRLRPYRPAWVAAPDSFDQAAAILRNAGLGVRAWVVLNHNSRLGADHLDQAVVNCFGERYRHVLCLRSAEVRDYLATLAAECVTDVELCGVLLEAWGQRGAGHDDLHDKTAGAWPGVLATLMSICCCAACRADWAVRGLDPSQTVATLRGTIQDLQHGRIEPAPVEVLLGEPVALALQQSRWEAFAATRDGAVAAVHAANPGVGVTVFVGTDPWGGAPVQSFSPVALDRLDTGLLSAWPADSHSVTAAKRLRALLPESVRLAAYLTVLPPVGREQLVSTSAALLGQGVTQLQLYHLGLAGRDRQEWLRAIV